MAYSRMLLNTGKEGYGYIEYLKDAALAPAGFPFYLKLQKLCIAKKGNSSLSYICIYINVLMLSCGGFSDMSV